MREVLFRGKRTDCEAWVEGDLLHYESGEMAICKGFSKYGYEATEIIGRYKVIPETDGQYTGVKTYSKHDDELHKIFEDDLCYVTEFDCDGNDEQHLCQVMFDCGTFYFKDVNSDWCRAFYEIGDIESDVELVGNIHDNPEILKGGEDNG